MSWTNDMRRRILNPGTLAQKLHLDTPEEDYWKDPRSRENLPLAVTEHFLGLFAGAGKGAGAREGAGAGAAGDGEPGDFENPLRLQCIPRLEELETRPYEDTDPLGERHHSPLPGMVHQYAGRILVKTTDNCALYCRHCFRRTFSGKARGRVTPAELRAMAEYLADRREVKEILLSGGDCLTLSDGVLTEIMDTLEPRRAPEERRVFRICSRVPVVLPRRITGGLMGELKRRQPLWLVTQVNHPAELAPPVREALARFVDNGIPVVNQTVLLRGVNDDPAVLAELFQELVACRVKPGYLFQGDLAPGTARFRVNLDRAGGIVEELKNRVSGLAMPVYAVDLPGGGGKVTLYPANFLRDEEDPRGITLGWRVFRGGDGREYRYPLEIE